VDNTGVGTVVVDMRDVMSPQSRLSVVAVFGAAPGLRRIIHQVDPDM